MAAHKLPILNLAVNEQHYSCHGCGNCCRDFTVQLRDEDLAKLKSQDWENRLGHPITVSFRGTTYLRQRADGACVFLTEDGLCRIHKEFGFSAKPIACQLFPFHILPNSGGKGLMMGISFACQSVLENKGAQLRTHIGELQRMAGRLDELSEAPPEAAPLLTDKLRASPAEADSLVSHVDRWLRRTDVPLAVRLDGLAWIAGSLARAKLEGVRERRFNDLLDVLFGALPDELAHHPIEPATSRQLRMLRQAVFARTEDPKLNAIESQGRLRLTLSQLMRSRRFKSGRGIAPKVGQGWPDDVALPRVAEVGAARDAGSSGAIDDLMTRYLRATVLGGRAWGPGYYGWPMIAGLQAVLLNAACVGWLARLHAAGRALSPSPSGRGQVTVGDSPGRGANDPDRANLHGNIVIDIIDVRAALGRVDRSAGRAKWLGGTAERLRLVYLNLDDGLRRVLQAQRMV